MQFYKNVIPFTQKYLHSLNQVSREVKTEMRAYLWGEFRIVIKDVLKKEEISFSSKTGYISMEQIQKKYHVSKTTICKK